MRIVAAAPILMLCACASGDRCGTTRQRAPPGMLITIRSTLSPAVAPELPTVAALSSVTCELLFRRNRHLETEPYRAGRPTPSTTLVVEVAVVDVLKGSADGSIYFEIMYGAIDEALSTTGGVGVSDLGQIMLFAVDANDGWPASTLFVEDRRGVPEGAPLYRPVNPQGMIEDDEGVLKQLDGLVFTATDMAGISSEIASML